MPNDHDTDYHFDSPTIFPLVRMRIDRNEYSLYQPPCQLLPLLIGTSNIDLYIESEGGIQFRSATKDIKHLISRGVYMWAKSLSPIENPMRGYVGFLLGASSTLAGYRPIFTEAGVKPTIGTAGVVNISWNTAPVLRFTPPKDSGFDYDL